MTMEWLPDLITFGLTVTTAIVTVVVFLVSKGIKFSEMSKDIDHVKLSIYDERGNSRVLSREELALVIKSVIDKERFASLPITVENIQKELEETKKFAAVSKSGPYIDKLREKVEVLSDRWTTMADQIKERISAMDKDNSTSHAEVKMGLSHMQDIVDGCESSLATAMSQLATLTVKIDGLYSEQNISRGKIDKLDTDVAVLKSKVDKQ